jgi:hypothetical protein
MLLVAIPQASAATTSLSASGTGAEEVPPAVATDTVAATLDIDTATGKITYQVSFHGTEPVLASHIHKAQPGVAGPVVVPLDEAVVNSGGTGTVTVDKSLAAAIAADPGSYYLNVHTASHSAGAARGQLTAAAGPTPTAVNAGTGGQFAATHGGGGGGTPTLMILVGALLLGVGGVGALAVRRRHN